MKTEKKFFLDKNEDLDVAVHRLIEARSHIVVLNIPRDSVLASSVSNFHVLKRESSTADKELHVESVDDRILELASLAKIKAFNPVFRQRERIISDILPRPVFKKMPAASVEEKIVEEEEVEERVAASGGGEPRPKEFLGRNEEIYIEPKKIVMPVEAKKAFRNNKRHRVLKRTFSFALLVLVVLGGMFVANRVLPKATVEMILKKVPVTFAYEVEATSKHQVASAEGTEVILPAELLKAKGNLSLSFPASGREKVERKAGGILTVYNAYSSESQVLVATTRFVSPSGKIFRLAERVTIPGAKIENGKIVPFKINVRVTADEAGNDYNIGPEKHWRIPGFKGDPRYEGFYADSEEAMSGGFVGEEAVPTEEDISKGKAKLLSDLEGVLEAQVLILLSDKFKVFPDAREFEVLNEKIETAGSEDLPRSAGEAGSFRVFAEAELRYLVFEEKMLEEAVVSDAVKTVDSNTRVKEFVMSYGEPRIDFEKTSMVFPVEGKVVFEPNLDVEELKREFAGQNEEELRKTVFFLSGLERANISLWPFWVQEVPANPDKVKIILN
ncbi:MAG: hypothetical protein V2A55_03565 [Candidatus Jorgensenbacteria bacterium]